MTQEPVDLVRVRLERELAATRRMNDQLAFMLGEMTERKRREEPPTRPHLYIVE